MPAALSTYLNLIMHVFPILHLDGGMFEPQNSATPLNTQLVLITYDTPREMIERSFDLFVNAAEKKLDAALQPENA